MTRIHLVVASLAATVALGGCQFTDTVTETPMDTTHEMRLAGSIDGEAIRFFTLRNANGMSVELMEYGATVTRVVVPDRSGAPVDVVLGFDTVEEYPEKSQYFGCTVGRVGNRIAGGSFELDGVVHELAANENGNLLHGGAEGFGRHRWDVLDTDGGVTVGREQLDLQPSGEAGAVGPDAVHLRRRVPRDHVTTPRRGSRRARRRRRRHAPARRPRVRRPR